MWGGTKNNQPEEQGEGGSTTVRADSGWRRGTPPWVALSLESDYRGVSLSLKRERDYPKLIPTLTESPMGSFCSENGVMTNPQDWFECSDPSLTCSEWW